MPIVIDRTVRGGKIAACAAEEPASTLAAVAGGFNFLPIHAQQLGTLGAPLANVLVAFDDMQRGQWLQHSRLGVVVVERLAIGQQILAAHKVAQTPGAMALANITVATTRRTAFINLPLAVNTCILEHYRWLNAFPIGH